MKEIKLKLMAGKSSFCTIDERFWIHHRSDGFFLDMWIGDEEGPDNFSAIGTFKTAKELIEVIKDTRSKYGY